MISMTTAAGTLCKRSAWSTQSGAAGPWTQAKRRSCRVAMASKHRVATWPVLGRQVVPWQTARQQLAKHLAPVDGDRLEFNFQPELGACRATNSYSVCLCRSQLWANEGFWPGFGQLMPREFSADAQRWQFPSTGVAYGFTTWLDYGFDPVSLR